MSITDRDKKILLALVPLALILGFWFLVLAPKRAEVSRLDEQVTSAQDERDTAVNNVRQLESARNSYASDYETVVRLGKAVPASLDMPSLLVQLDAAAKGTKIDFDSVKAGERTAAAAPTPAPTPSGGGSGSSGSQPPAAAGGQPAQTGPGKSAEKADNAKSTANQDGQRASDTGTSSPGSAPAAGAAGGAAPTSGSGAPGLDSVPLEFGFTGSFFDLADFFHRMKRFVRVTNKKIKVQGRLMTIDSLDFKSEAFPSIVATVKATVYLSPKDQGATAGATPAGPQAVPTGATPPANGSPTPPSGSAPPAAPASAPSSGGAAQ